MTADRQSENVTEQRPDGADTKISIPPDTAEALLRQMVALRSTAAVDDQLTQLMRIVDSATWSTPVPMTILIDGALLRGILVPSEVSATFLDDALRHSAHAAVDQLETVESDSEQGEGEGAADAEATATALQQARAFLRRVRRRPFASLQAGVRQRNAKALIAISDWHEKRDVNARHTPLDIPGSYADPASVVRDVLLYTAGQRALTLADVKMLVAGEWLAINTPMRIAIGRIGAWTVDL
jgi:hypothetical protein